MTVRASGEWLGAFQDAIDPAWTRTMAGCHLNRDTAGTIRHAGFRLDKIARGLKGIFIRGTAVAG